MAAVDWILLGVLVFSMALGAWRGLVYEVLSVLGWAVAFYAAQWFAPQVSVMLPIKSASDPVRFARIDANQSQDAVWLDVSLAVQVKGWLPA